MPTLPNMSLITPTLGGDSGTWDDKINAALGLIDAHDHTAGKGVLVPVSGLNINADFAMAGYAVTGLGSIAFNAVTALVAGSKRLFVSSADNELYWRSNAGTNVKLTAGASINTTLVGGIVGDYSTVGALLAYDDANKQYTFKTQTSTWARLASGPVRIYEYNTTESVYVEHAVAAALASSYTVTWPAALPASTAIVQISSAGVVSYATTLPTITADTTLSANKNVVLSGSGVVKHGDYTQQQALDPVYYSTGSPTKSSNLTGVADFGWSLPASTTTYFIIQPPLDGRRLKSLTVYGGVLTGAGSATYDFVYQTGPNVFTSLLSAPVTTGAATVVLTVAGTGYTWNVSASFLMLRITIPAATTYGYRSVGLVFDNP